MPTTKPPNLAPFVISNTTDIVRSETQVRIANLTGPATIGTSGGSIYAYPFTVPTTCTIYKAYWYNGTSPNAGVSLEVTLWSDEYVKLVTTGAVVQDTGIASGPQVADITDTILTPGRYYCSFGANVGQANRAMGWSGTGLSSVWRILGCWNQNSLTIGSLPSTATPVAYGATAQYLSGFITRSNYDL